MKKILILGSDYCTLQVAREAKAMGMYVIVADLMESSPTKDAADEAWMISTTDTELLCDRCREEGVSAVMFGASDFNISNGRIICKELNLPIYCSSDKAWDIARNKRMFKDLCLKNGVSVAEDYRLNDRLIEADLEQVKFPVVVKPADKSGNRGMHYCSNARELIDGYRDARSISDQPVIVERQLNGKEYNVHYLLAEGEPRLLYFSSSHRDAGQEKNIYSLKVTTSHFLKQYLQEMNEPVKKVIKEAGCREGIVWIDCMRDEDGHFYALEMGYRFGGVMTYVPYEKLTGFNTTRWMVEYAAGVKHKISDMPCEHEAALRGCAASYNLFSLEGGEIAEIRGLEDIEALDNVFVDMPKRVGSSLRSRTNSGLIGIHGKDLGELCSTLEYINSKLHIVDAKGRDMVIKYHDCQGLKEEYYAGLNEFEK